MKIEITPPWLPKQFTIVEAIAVLDEAIQSVSENFDAADEESSRRVANIDDIVRSVLIASTSLRANRN
ncbi:hypothetical protein [Maritimibacter sp. DP1N21-5]|uniref:hypothetical protein n=1 Tax=Maritimibacter sp. DP1N21-5 TaxID=2836867 RepID=UPI001C45D8F7|nr:hypothetical protein [Maritimibacter sp. DP1N21-5]MBV7409623.1 hypothetical protein [Maritimibacter sp. DP1N21-5]